MFSIKLTAGLALEYNRTCFKESHAFILKCFKYLASMSFCTRLSE